MWSFPLRKLSIIAITLLLSTFTILLLTSFQQRPSHLILNTLLKTHIRHPTYISSTSLSTVNNTTPINLFNDAPPPIKNPHLKPLLTCPRPPDKLTSHIRLPNIHFNISLTPPSANSHHDPNKRYFNPTIIPLPHWSGRKGKYILVSRVVTSGLHQESVACYADFCLPGPFNLPYRSSPNSNSNTTIHPHAYAKLPPDTHLCNTTLHTPLLGTRGGMYCVTDPITLNIPPTPALQCDGDWTAFPDIPGFHDPRIFWSKKGEPLIIVNSASAYGCVGLWVVDLRTLVPGLDRMLVHGLSSDEVEGQNLKGKGWEALLGPVMSYSHLTELTRNSRSSRNSVEKNWMLWFPNDRGAVIGYDMLGHLARSNAREEGQDLKRSGDENRQHERRRGTKNVTAAPDTEVHNNMPPGGRTFAQLIGNGHSTPNLTSTLEPSCFNVSHHHDNLGRLGHWHQGSNSLRLILCTRAQAQNGHCSGLDIDGGVKDGVSVHFAIMHRKFSNEMDLPLRYERFIVVWESRKPYRVVGISQYPVLMWDEKANGWDDENVGNRESWNNTIGRKGGETEIGSGTSSAYFTYTPSLALAWRPKTADVGIYDRKDQDNVHDDDDEYIKHLSRLGTGFLGDEVLMGVGMDDRDQAVVRVKVEELLQCLRLCPGISDVE